MLFILLLLASASNAASIYFDEPFLFIIYAWRCSSLSRFYLLGNLPTDAYVKENEMDLPTYGCTLLLFYFSS